jgi:hypothetical protein
MKPCNESIKKALGMAAEMLAIADEGDGGREDSSCGVLYSVIRDSAFKIKKLAEAEKESHIRKGKWK